MNEVIVSIIMGVYNMNNKSMLSEAIQSMLDQTFRDFEFIICDDGSTDGTYELLEDFAKKDDRIIVVQNETNLGLASTLNKCIKLSKGAFIARMDADDISAPNRLEKEYNFLIQNPKYAMVGCSSYIINNRGICGKRSPVEYPVNKTFLFNSPFIHPTIMIRKDVITLLEGYRVSRETKRTEDYDMFMRLYYNNYIGYNLQELLYYYREDEQSIKKRKYRYRIEEAIVRYKGFKSLKLLPLGYVYIIKPLIVGLIPYRLLRKFKTDIAY